MYEYQIDLGQINMQSSRFTLVELLVVVAIISILAALLLPTLQTAQESALAVPCISNQKQIGFAVHSYCDEFNDYTPTAYAPGHMAWYWLLGGYIDGRLTCWHCPASTGDGSRLAATLHNRPTGTADSSYNAMRSHAGIGINGYAFSGRNATESSSVVVINKRSVFKYPSFAVYSADGRTGIDQDDSYSKGLIGQTSANNSQVRLKANGEIVPYDIPSNFTYSARHLLNLNMGFLDNHVENVFIQTFKSWTPAHTVLGKKYFTADQG